MHLLPSIIYKSTLMICVFVIYGYGIYHWQANKHHFVILSRIPSVSYFIAGLLFLLLLISWLGDILINFEITNPQTHDRMKYIKVAFGFTLCSLSAARSFVIYKRYRFMQSLVNNEGDKIFRNHTQFKMIIIYTVIGLIFIPFTPLIGLWLPIIFFVSCCIMLVTLIILMIRFQDGIGCTKETIVLCVISFLCIASGPLPHQILSYLAFTLFFVYACLIWCCPIFYIRAIERSKRVLLTSRMEPPNMSEVDDLHPSPVATTDHVGRTKDVALDISLSYLHKPLYIFLKKKQNYTLFKEYLAHCFAVECLMFVQSVVIFCDLLIRDYNGSISSTQKTLHHEDRIMMQRILDIKFVFLREYDQYKTKMHSVNKAEWKTQRKVYFQICLDIFNTFIVSNAVYQINIPAAVHQSLERVFLNQLTPDQFTDLNDFVYIFQEAVLETYHLMNSLYSFNFEQFVSKRIT